MGGKKKELLWIIFIGEYIFSCKWRFDELHINQS